MVWKCSINECCLKNLVIIENTLARFVVKCEKCGNRFYMADVE
jgi:hypothetical protein